MAAGGLYLLLSVLLWSHVWFGHPSVTTICGCGDPAGALWVVEWPAYAISHGLNPFFSTAMAFPAGFNLLANASILFFGVLLAPVTWLFGPVATLNVALTVSPALSALAMFFLLRRWVAWTPAAFIGGLLYGFSPYVLVSLSTTAVNFGMAAVPPLVIACLDTLLTRPRVSPVRVGVVLGFLVAVQFFIGTEVLAFMALFGALGLGLVVVATALRRPPLLRADARRVATGLAAAFVTSVVLLGYPAWFAMKGPAHYSGAVWPGGIFALRRNQHATLGLFVHRWPAIERITDYHLWHAIGGYQGTPVSWQFLGIGLVTVLVAGLVLLRNNFRLLLFGAVAVAATVLSLGAERNVLLPWELLAHVRVLANITPYHFTYVVFVAVAIMLGLTIDGAYLAAKRWARNQPGRRGVGAAPAVSALVGLVVAALALVEPATYMAQTLPFAATPVVLPTWFRTVAPRLPAHQVLLVLPGVQPFPLTSMATPVAWQAVDRMHYSMVDLIGPSSLLSRVGAERAGADVIANTTSFYGAAEAIDTTKVSSVRQALRLWGVTMVVIPDQPALPPYYRVRSVPAAAALISAATGTVPVHQADAWVWSGVEHARPSISLEPTRFTDCTRGASAGALPVLAASTCVLEPSAG